MRVTERFKTLLAVPSFHFHPVYGREVGRALAQFAPKAVALEIRAGWESELQWAIANWPVPTVSHADGQFLPFVAGDSMIEAYRLSVAAGLPVFCIDLGLKEPIIRVDDISLPDPAFAPRVGAAFLQAIDAMEAAAGPPAPGDLAREAHMAARLDALMRDYSRVLWVGGMAHWSRIRERLQTHDFDAPALQTVEPPRQFRRMRLAASALHWMTDRFPFQVADFARQPTRYTEAACLQKLALAAGKGEKFRGSEIAAMLRYARNLAALKSIGETPGLWDLLLSASAMLSSEYASRLATLALEDHFAGPSLELPELSYDVEERTPGQFLGVYRCQGEVLAGVPLLAPPRSVSYQRLPSADEIRRRRRNDPASEGVPGQRGEKEAWASLPDEDASYEAFVRYVLEQAGRADTGETTAVPLVSGMGDGIDVRATIRHWDSGRIYVREPERGSIRIANGLIDFTASSEQERVACPFGGWIDPSYTTVGSVSMESQPHDLLQSQPFHIQRNYRELSLMTLDTPTWIKGKDGRSFHDHVIQHLVKLGKADHNLYDWLSIMFEFCRNKPFAYCSRYKPSAKVHSLGRRFNVRVVHLPLRRIAKALRERHQSFRFMSLTRRQWDDLLIRLRESRRAWVPPQAVEGGGRHP